jgi:hypothetical protein
MQAITSTNELKEAIQELQRKQVIESEMLKEQFSHAVEKIRPAVMLKDFGENIVSAGLRGNILNATVGLTAGYISKRLFVGASSNRFRIVLGNILQLGILGVTTRNPALVRSLMDKLLKRFMKKKDIS